MVLSSILNTTALFNAANTRFALWKRSENPSFIVFTNQFLPTLLFSQI